MAFTAKVEWDVRTTGTDINGGGFDPLSGTPGTDYSQQNAAQIAYTDLVIDGTTNTKCTSAGNPFTSAHVGNIINVTGGTGFTVQRVQILSVAAAAATVDKSLGTLSSTGGTGNLGGSLLTNLRAIALTNTAGFDAAFGNTIHVKAGTYTITAALGPTPSVGNLFIIGYQTTHNDGGTKPLITTSTNSVNIYALGNGANWTVFNNLSISSTATTRGGGIVHIGTNPQANAFITNCTLDGFQWGVGADNFNFNTFTLLVIENTEIKNIVSNGGTNAGNGVHTVNSSGTFLSNCYIHDCAGVGVKVTSGTLRMYRCTFDTNGSDGVVYSVTNGALESINCNYYNNTGDGLDLSGSGAYNPAGTAQATLFLIQNNIFWGNGAYGINWFTYFVPVPANRTNAYGSNGTAARNNLAAGLGDVTITVDPFTNGGSGDFSLNDTAGGGAACKAAGFQRTY